MKCTIYALGEYLDEKEDLPKVIKELRKLDKSDKYFPDSEYKNLAKQAILDHNQAYQLMEDLDGRFRYEYENQYHVVDIKNIDINNNKNELNIVLADNTTIKYKIDNKNLKAINHPFYSRDLELQWNDVVSSPIELLFNGVDAKSKNLDNIIEGKELLDGNIEAIQTELSKLDRIAPNSSWDQAHSNHLKEVISRISRSADELKTVQIKVTKNLVENLKEPLGSYNTKSRTIQVATAEAMTKFGMSNEETLAHEYLHAVLDILFNKQLGVMGEDIKNDLRKLYVQAKKNITWKDLMPANELHSKAAENKAKEIYDYIFIGKIGDNSVEDAEVRLMEFLVYGMTNKELKSAIDKISLKVKPVKAKSSGLSGIFEYLMEKLQDLVFKIKTKTNRSDNVGSELTRLVYKLGTINKMYAKTIENNKNLPLDEKIFSSVDKVFSKMDKELGKKVESITNDFLNEKDGDKIYTNDLITQVKMLSKELTEAYNKGKIIKTAWLSIKGIFVIMKAYRLSKQSKNENIQRLYKELDRLLRRMDEFAGKFISDLLRDFKEGRKTLVQLGDITMQFKTQLDRVKDMYYKGTLNDIFSGFTKVDLTHERHKKLNQSLTNVILRTDVQSFTTDVNELKKYITDDKKLSNTIKELEDELSQAMFNSKTSTLNVGPWVVNECKELASYMISRKGKRNNATNISHLFGTTESVPLDESLNGLWNIQNIEEKIDKLTSLYALKNTSIESKKALIELIDLDKNGVQNYLEITRGMVASTKEDWFVTGSLSEMVKGQIHETHNKDKELVFAPLNETNAMLEAGYSLVRKLDKDAGDIDIKNYGLFVTNTKGVTKRVDGALGLQRIKIPGLLLSQKIMMSNKHLTGKSLGRKIRNAINNARVNGTDGKMYPVYNDLGNIIDYRYEFTLDEAEQYMDLETRGSENLARSFGQKSSQIITDEHNKELIDLIMEDSKKITNENKDQFLRVHAVENTDVNSGSKIDTLNAMTEGEELWGLLPADARKYIIEKNIENLNDPDNIPKKEIYISKDLLKQLFGYDELSIADSKLFKKMDVKNKNRIRMIEAWWMDLMQIAKSMVVVKMPSTIIGNILSNAKFFMFSGVSPRKAIQYLLLSKKSLDKWKKNEKARRDLERKIDIATGSKKEQLLKQLADLALELKDNPIMPLIEAGLYQTIAEDIDTEDSTNRVVQLLDKTLDPIYSSNKTIEDIINTVFLTKKSTLGQGLLHIMQESDFHFRSAIYWDGIEKGISKDKMLRDVTDKFINYSRVTNSRLIHWLDRMGPEAFWKYFANIQRVNWSLMKKNSTKVILDTTIKETGVPLWSNDVLDSSIIYQFGRRFNPLNWINNTEGLLNATVDVPITHLIDGY